jgi:hypothetical protein
MVAGAEAEVRQRHPISTKEAKGEPPGARRDCEHRYETGCGTAPAQAGKVEEEEIYEHADGCARGEQQQSLPEEWQREPQ